MSQPDIPEYPASPRSYEVDGVIDPPGRNGIPASTGYAPATVYDVSGQTATEESSGTVDVAKDQAANVKDGALDAGQQVAGVAKDQAGQVLAETGRQAKDLIDQTRGELTEQAGSQQRRLASGLHSLADELHSMTQHDDDKGVATDLARQGADRGHQIASWLEDREPGDVLGELKSFARQRPGTFLLAAAGIGLLAGRLTRGIKDAGGGRLERLSGTDVGHPSAAGRPEPSGVASRDSGSS